MSTLHLTRMFIHRSRTSWEAGKVFARRQTFWNALFTILGSRERDMASLLVQLLITTLVNFTTGLCASVLVFVATLPSLLLSYQPGWVRKIIGSGWGVWSVGQGILLLLIITLVNSNTGVCA